MALTKLTFDNRFINTLPSDKQEENNQRQVHHAAFSLVSPTKVSNPQLIAVSEDLALMLGFTKEDIKSEQFSQTFSGNTLMDGMQSYAMCYGGHQFGHWAGQLGDGRAINLGEVVTNNNGHQTLQLKGAGPTPYSRTADGLAVLRSSIREFLCSEAMFHLGISTTRALSLSLTGEQVMRDMFYDGHNKNEPGAVVCRVSKSFMRFGSFQLPAQRGDIELLKAMAEHSISSDFPHLLGDTKVFNKQVYLNWFSAICQSTCEMIVNWQRVGFVHGVMNTDNMSILGETIDYGPYGWIDNFDLNWTPNTTDANGKRYRFGAQAEIGQWNLFQLANAIFPLISDAKPLEELLNGYARKYQTLWHEMMLSKIGLRKSELSNKSNGSSPDADDEKLLLELEEILSLIDTDMTIFYRQLAKLPMISASAKQEQWMAIFADCYYQIEQANEQYRQKMSDWLTCYINRFEQDEITFQQHVLLMNQTNPKYVLRNYLAQQAIELAEQGDFTEITRLQALLKYPYQEQIGFEQYANKRPSWAENKAGCSMLSCSS
ncbi:MAG: YdiU family protein [Colwellia sp.]|nr:YdiU family protein [Colwellia sp.]